MITLFNPAIHARSTGQPFPTYAEAIYAAMAASRLNGRRLSEIRVPLSLAAEVRETLALFETRRVVFPDGSSDHSGEGWTVWVNPQ